MLFRAGYCKEYGSNWFHTYYTYNMGKYGRTAKRRCIIASLSGFYVEYISGILNKRKK